MDSSTKEQLREETIPASPMVSPPPSSQCLQDPRNSPLPTLHSPMLLSPDWPLLTVAPANSPVWPLAGWKPQAKDTEQLLLTEAARRLKNNEKNLEALKSVDEEDTGSEGEKAVQGKLVEELRATLPVPGLEEANDL